MNVDSDRMIMMCGYYRLIVEIGLVMMFIRSYGGNR